MTENARTLTRADGTSGEVVIRAAGSERELIVNGVYLMDTRRDGSSERLLARAAVELCARPDPRCLVGGLGFGYTLAELLALRPAARVTCVELEPEVVAHYARAASPTPAVNVVVGDVFERLTSDPTRYDVILLDVDNGPSWTVRAENGRLYDAAGLRLVSSRLEPGGVLGVWSARPEPDFADQLAAVFARTQEIQVPVERAAPDVVYLATD